MSMIMKTVTAIIERGTDGRYSVFIEDKDYPYGVIGTGATVKEAEADFMEGYEDMRLFVEESDGEFEAAEFVFKYDVPSFLQAFAFAFSLAGLERITGINQKQLGHYISGFRHPSPTTVRKIESAIHSFSEQLAAIRFI